MNRGKQVEYDWTQDEEIPLSSYVDDLSWIPDPGGNGSGPPREAGPEPEPEKQPAGNPFMDPVNVRKMLATKPAPIQWLIKDRLPLGRGTLITGLGGSSKTRMLYHIALGCITGKLPWSWNVEKTGKAVLILMEDTYDDVARKTYDQTLNTGIPLDSFADNLILFPMAGREIKLLRKTKTGSLYRTDHFYQLQEKIKAIGNVVFVGLDPALDLTEGDEMVQGDQRTLGKAVDAIAIFTGATTMIASHSSKSILYKSELGSHNSRGGGAITDAVRAEYSIRNMTPQEAATCRIDDPEEAKRIIQIACTKGNDIPPSAFVPIWLRRNNYGALEEADLEFSEIILNQTDMEIFQVLVEMTKTACPTLGEWREEARRRGLVRGKTDEATIKAMTRTRKKLERAGKIETGIGKGIWKPKIERETTGT